MQDLPPELALDQPDIEFGWSGARPLSHTQNDPMGQSSWETPSARSSIARSRRSMNGRPVAPQRFVGLVGHRKIPSCTLDPAKDMHRALPRKQQVTSTSRKPVCSLSSDCPRFCSSEERMNTQSRHLAIPSGGYISAGRDASKHEFG